MMKRRGGRKGLLTAAALCAVTVTAVCCFFFVFAAAADHTCVPGEKTIEDVVEPTCMTEGTYNEVIRCAVCNEVISTTPVTLKKTTAHTWGVGIVTKPVTKTEAGEMTYYCIVEGCPASKTVEIPVPQFIPGDVDGDGEVSAGDSRWVLRYSTGFGAKDQVISSDPEDETYKAADYNEDGTIDAADARLVLRKSAGLSA